jgi:hypothetical protein
MPNVLMATYCSSEKIFCNYCHKLIGLGEQMIDEPIPKGAGKCFHFHIVPCYLNRLGYEVRELK